VATTVGALVSGAGVHLLPAERDGCPPIALCARVPRVERLDELLDLGGHAPLRMNVEYGGQKLVLLLVRGALDRCCDVAIWTAVAQHERVVMLIEARRYGPTSSPGRRCTVRV
jgi:hypothetical protein